MNLRREDFFDVSLRLHLNQVVFHQARGMDDTVDGAKTLLGASDDIAHRFDVGDIRGGHQYFRTQSLELPNARNPLAGSVLGAMFADEGGPIFPFRERGASDENQLGSGRPREIFRDRKADATETTSNQVGAAFANHVCTVRSTSVGDAALVFLFEAGAASPGDGRTLDRQEQLGLERHRQQIELLRSVQPADDVQLAGPRKLDIDAAAREPRELARDDTRRSEQRRFVGIE